MSHGRLLNEEQISSRSLGGHRTVRLYLPPSYGLESKRRYPVLYLHDGQNVFSSAGSNACFGWGHWALDRTVDELCAAGRMREILMVAEDHSRSRYSEYRGPGASQLKPGRGKRASSSSSDPSRFDLYANFLIRELKPKIDREYRTLKAPAHTGLLGSSLGGIASIALAWEHAKTFGLAASLSGSFEIEKRAFLDHSLRAPHARRKPLRLYLDSGVIDYTGDDDGRKDTEAVAAEFRRIGWKDGVNLQHFIEARPLTEAELARTDLPRDKWPEALISQHNEFYWRHRAWRALTFLFPPR